MDQLYKQKASECSNADLVLGVGIFLRTMGNDDSALNVLQRVVDLKRTEIDLAHLEALSTMAKIYAGQGKLLEAREISDRTLHHQESLTGKRSEAYAIVLADRAFIMVMLGNYEEAVTAQQTALKIRIAEFGSDHKNTWSSWLDLSQYLFRSSKYGEALTAANEAMKIVRVTYGVHHQQAAKVYSRQGIILTEQGKYDEAEEKFKLALSITEEYLGDRSPDFLSVSNQFASLLRRIKKLDDAKRLLERGLLLVNNERDKAAIYTNIANIYNEQHNYDQSHSYSLKALNIYEPLLGNHPDVATALMNMGSNKHVQGEYEEAR